MPPAADTTGLPPTTVPPLPENFVPRDEELNSLVNLLVEKRDRRTIALTSVQGMGGIGKTVLVQALCEDPRVKAAFPDGIIWQSIGKESAYKMADRLRAGCLALNGNCEFSRSEADHYQLLIASSSHTPSSDHRRFSAGARGPVQCPLPSRHAGWRCQP